MCEVRRREGRGGEVGTDGVFSGMVHLSQEIALLLTSVSDGSLCLSGGLALAQVIFFYLKYLVLFGVPALLMRLDGLTPPPLPRCVSTMFSFTGMWRSVVWFIKALWGCPVGGAMAWRASKGLGHCPFSVPQLRPQLALGFLHLSNRMAICAF